jgi:endo-1,4-beta-xylanase
LKATLILDPSRFSELQTMANWMIFNNIMPDCLKTALFFGGLVLTCNGQPFRELAPPGLYVGSVFHGYGNTWDEPDYQKLALDNFNIMTSSIYMSTVWDSPEKPIDTGPFKEVVDFLSKNNILVHGHAMHYPNIAASTNWWSKQPINTVESNMYKYMKTVVSAGGGKVYSWDVLNEVMGDDNNDNDADGVRKTLYDGTPIIEYKAMGQDYIRAAFRFARSVAPDAKLLLTDYGAEEDSEDNDNQKSDRLYRFVKKLLAEGIPIDGIGFKCTLTLRKAIQTT